jgi:hypothetical protein
VAHGGEYEGSREELGRYAKLVSLAVERGIGRAGAGAKSSYSRGKRDGTTGSSRRPPRRLHDPIAAERLREQKVARLDREWRMEQKRYMVRGRNGRLYQPGRGMSLAMGLFAVVFAIAWSGSRHETGGSLFGIVIAGAVLLWSVYAYNKASAYAVAEARYQREREDLLEADGDDDEDEDEDEDEDDDDEDDED